MTGHTKPVLTAEQVQRIWECGGYAKAEFEKALQDMGLIAPEPDERVSALVKYFAEIGILITERQAEIAVELVASRMALAKPELTREMVREAYHAAQIGTDDTSFIDRLYAAITQVRL